MEGEEVEGAVRGEELRNRDTPRPHFLLRRERGIIIRWRRATETFSLVTAAARTVAS